MKAVCPVCDANLKLATDLVESEVFECTECGRKIVVEKMNKSANLILAEAPVVEEDWGE